MIEDTMFDNDCYAVFLEKEHEKGEAMDDLISRQAAIEWCLEGLNNMPSADRNGHWIYGEHEVAMCDGYRCDQCGFFITWDYNHTSPYFIEEYHFCPNCGAKMVREDGEA